MVDETSNLVLFGCGGHSRSVADVFLKNNPKASLVFVDPNARENETIWGFPVVKEFITKDLPVFIAIGNNLTRMQFYEAVCAKENLISVISHTAHIGLYSQISIGCFVGNFAHIGPDVFVGKNTIVNNAAIVEHEVRIGDHCHIGPNATISGRCNIGDMVFIGVGATIKDNIDICSNVTIGAGATVVKKIEVPGVYVGTPVKLIK